MKLNGRSFLFSLFSFLSLPGCVSLPERPPVENPAAVWQARAASLRPLADWEIQGRLSLRTADEGWQAALTWSRRQDRHRIDLTGPLGHGHLRLTQEPGAAELRDADQNVTRDSSVQQLLLRATGWQIPLEGLNYWVLGLPAPDVSNRLALDAWGRLETLEQLGWDVRFLEYARYGEYELPSKVFIKRAAQGVALPNGADHPTLEVRLVIERWLIKGVRGEE